MYALLKALHILSAAILFGTGLGIAFFQFAAYRGKDVAGFATIARLTVRADWIFTASAIVVQPLTGVMLLRVTGYAWDLPWLLWSYVLFVVAGVFWLSVVWMQMRIAHLAAQSRDQHLPLQADVHRLMRVWFWCGWPAFAALLGAYWLMITKPSVL